MTIWLKQLDLDLTKGLGGDWGQLRGLKHLMLFQRTWPWLSTPTLWLIYNSSSRRSDTLSVLCRHQSSSTNWEPCSQIYTPIWASFIQITIQGWSLSQKLTISAGLAGQGALRTLLSLTPRRGLQAHKAMLGLLFMCWGLGIWLQQLTIVGKLAYGQDISLAPQCRTWKIVLYYIK